MIEGKIKMFNQEFDRSLLMMLFSDKNNRRNIINFVKYIPNELYAKIFIQLDKYKKYEDNNIDILDREEFCLYGEYVDDNIKYSFIIDMVQNSLTITQSSFIGDNLKKQYELVLFTDSRYNNIEFSGKQLLGSFLDCKNDLKIEYELVSTRFGNKIVYSDNSIFKKYKRVNNTFQNMDVCNYLDESSYTRVRKLS